MPRSLVATVSDLVPLMPEELRSALKAAVAALSVCKSQTLLLKLPIAFSPVSSVFLYTARDNSDPELDVGTLYACIDATEEELFLPNITPVLTTWELVYED